MSKCHDLIRQIIDTADAIIARAAAIPIGDQHPYLLTLELLVALCRLEQAEHDLDNLTENDTRDGN